MRLSGRGINSCAQQLLDQPAACGVVCRRSFLDADQQVIDTGIALRFIAPHSFTGEDVLELHGHGGSAVMRRLLARCVELGARIAQPGEFSERAFLNGKLDLAQAESIADLVNATTERGAKLAIASLRGVLSERANQLASSIMGIRTHVEASIDFSDEDIDTMQDVRSQISELIEQARGFLNECQCSIAIGNHAYCRVNR